MTRVLAAALLGTALWLTLPVPVQPVSVASPRCWRRLVRPGRRRAAARAREASLLEACESIAGDLRAGLTPEATLARAAVDWPALRPAAQAAALGGDVPTALRTVAQEAGLRDLVLVAASWQVSQRSGTALAAGMSRVAARLRRLQASRRIVASELASARATARLMVGLPLFAMVLGSGVGGDPAGFLMKQPWGWACLVVGVGLDFLGLWWIDRIAQSIASGR